MQSTPYLSEVRYLQFCGSPQRLVLYEVVVDGPVVGEVVEHIVRLHRLGPSLLAPEYQIHPQVQVLGDIVRLQG
jgi:hypothetical protein